MAITNAQQYQQLVNPPMKGNKRPGYRGDDAYGGGDQVAGGGDQGNVGGNRDAREIGARQSRTQAMARANQRALAALGDPDPEVDVDTKDRQDTITSFAKNLNAARKANPLLTGLSLFNPMFAVPTFLKTAFQTGKARSMLGLPNQGPPSDTSRGGDEPVPYWAQLGFSSEAEYLASLAAQGTSTTEPEPEVEEPFQLARRFRAEGGIMNSDVVGGEFDFESARQMYGLGKLVKKVTKTVKKIAKSPIGKAALLYAGGSYLTGMGAFGGLKGAGALSKAKLFGTPGYFNIGSALHGGGTGKAIASTSGLLGKLGLTAGGGSMALTGKGLASVIGGTSLLAGLLTPEQEEEAQDLSRGEGIDIEAARRSILNAGTAQDFRARRFRAEGGSTEEKEPVAKKTMPLIDMGGKEKDYRETGGFVDMGRMEKADDVPARLSKNEFVFTADAVRNAGDGSVDKGAEVMYNMMKNLEAGGEVSEESQGLEGARKMFQTSQRLEEVL